MIPIAIAQMKLPNPLNSSQGVTRGGNIARSQHRKKVRTAVKWNVVAAVQKATGKKPPWSLPITVQLTRISSGTLDAWDGLPASLKPVIDGIADAFDLRDDDPRFTWLPPKQQKSKPGVFGVLIQIETRAT